MTCGNSKFAAICLPSRPTGYSAAKRYTSAPPRAPFSRAAEAAGRYVVAKLNVDENRGTQAEYQIQSIPTLLIFRQVGLNDTVAGLVLADTAFLLPLVVWLLKNVFEGVPRALESGQRR